MSETRHLDPEGDKPRKTDWDVFDPEAHWLDGVCRGNMFRVTFSHGRKKSLGSCTQWRMDSYVRRLPGRNERSSRRGYGGVDSLSGNLPGKA